MWMNNNRVKSLLTKFFFTSLRFLKAPPLIPVRLTFLSFFVADQRSPQWFLRGYRVKQQLPSYHSQPTIQLRTKQYATRCGFKIARGQISSSFEPKIQLDFWWRRRWRRQACHRRNLRTVLFFKHDYFHYVIVNCCSHCEAIHLWCLSW